ncbi:hypothetical protein B0H34DRAFT_798918 [Crassisporium funariophilum]|nr:hypothetical protein B0H34DRAFT_798918 [Crassisporium funariophilum]
MAHMAQPNTGLPSTGAGRAFLVGGSIVALGLGGFYANMIRNKANQERLATNPHHEQIIAHVSLKPIEGEALHHGANARYGDIPPAFRGKDHHSAHETITTFKNTPEYAEAGPAARYMVPPPQRPQLGKPDVAYTKSPDYAKNYEKTVRPRKIVKESSEA